MAPHYFGGRCEPKPENPEGPIYWHDTETLFPYLPKSDENEDSN